MKNKHYCPFCQRDIEPFIDEETGEPLIVSDRDDPLDKGGFVYVHDDVPHDNDYTFEALQ
jgi:hypothetical protein